MGVREEGKAGTDLVGVDSQDFRHAWKKEEMVK